MEGDGMERAMVPTDLKLTTEDYELFPDDGRRHELIDGEHVVTPSPTVSHQLVSGNLFEALRNAVRALGTGVVMYAPMDVILSHHDVVQPDLLYVSSERSGIMTDRLRGAPDLAVEILSPSSRRTDELLKRHVYERHGVLELWIVDPDIEVVRVYRNEGERFARPVELSAERGDTLTTALLPPLQVEVAGLFSRD
jgi:Uma2 family endonuclease